MSQNFGPSSDDPRSIAASLELLHALGPAMAHGQRAKIVEIVTGLIELDAPVGEQWEKLSQLVAAYGEIGLARRAMDRLVAWSGAAPLAIYKQAAMLEQSGALGEAYGLLRTLPEDQPTPSAHAYSRGTAALFLGQDEEARRYLSRAASLDPASGAAWLALAMAQDGSTAPELADRIASAAPRLERAPARQKAAYHYAAGKVRADLGEHEPALAAFREGARWAQSSVHFESAADWRDANEAVDGFTHQAVTELAGDRSDWPGRTIFVTGLPRSGTTLVEQILASHSQVGGGAEIDRLPLLANEVRGRSLAAVESYMQREKPGSAQALWDHWMDERFGTGLRVVDKSLTTSRFLGLAACLLPASPVIWLTRDPVDCAWSCFRTFIEGRFPWTYDLEQIARHFRLEDRLREQWRMVLGERMLIVPYEGLVSSPDEWIGRILRHCALTDEAGPYSPHSTARTVSTASVMQVRRPISRSAVGASGPYAQFMSRFVDAYRGTAGH